MLMDYVLERFVMFAMFFSPGMESIKYLTYQNVLNFFFELVINFLLMFFIMSVSILL